MRSKARQLVNASRCAIARERISFSCLLILARKIKVIEECEWILLKYIIVARDVSQLMEKREPEIIDPIVPKSESYDRRFPIEEHGCTIKEGSSSRPGVLRGPIRARAVWPSEPTFDCVAGRGTRQGSPASQKRLLQLTLAERTAFVSAQLSEYDCGWTETGEGGLQKVEPDESSQQQPIRADEP